MLPTAVQQQEDRANALYDRAYGSKDAPDAAPGQTPPPTPQTDAAAPPTQKPVTEETWEARFATLNGKYAAEVPRLAAEKRVLQGQVNDLTTKLGNTESRLEALEKVQTQAAVAPLVTTEDIESFGEPLVNLMRRTTREEMAKATPPANDEVRELRGKLDTIEQRTARSAEQMFFDRLGELVPDWIAVNASDAWKAWLVGIDELSGEERQTLLSRQQASLDAHRVAAFFKQFASTEASKAVAAQTELEQQVVPDTRGRATTPAGKRIWTRPEIAAFYADARAGRLTQAQYIAAEAEIDVAVAEGRVR